MAQRNEHGGIDQVVIPLGFGLFHHFQYDRDDELAEYISQEESCCDQSHDDDDLRQARTPVGISADVEKDPFQGRAVCRKVECHVQDGCVRVVHCRKSSNSFSFGHRFFRICEP